MPTTVDPSPSKTSRYLDVLGTLGCIALALGTVGFAGFRFAQTLPPGASRNQDRAFFHTIDALTLTGFGHAATPVASFLPLGLALQSLLMVGGAMLSLVGGGYFLAVAFGVRIRWPMLLALSAAILLVPAIVAWPWNGFDALAATTGYGSLTTRFPSELFRMLWALLSLPGLAGVMLLIALISPARITNDPRRYLLGTACAIGILYFVGMLLMRATTTSSFVTASFSAVNLQALGLAGHPLVASSTASWAAMMLMILGGGAASIGGGLGLLPLVILVRAVWDSIRNQPIDRLAGVAVLWVASYVAAFAVLILSLAAVEPAISGERLVLLAVSALNNVGVSHEPVGLTGGGLFVLGCGMLVGRFLPLAMLCGLAILASPAVLADGSNPRQSSDR